MIKIVLIGDSRVGKTSLRKSYMGETFQRTYSATLGADFSVKKFKDKKVIIYDLAGDRNSKLIRRQYYGGTQGVILVFDIANRETFEHLPEWVDEIKNNIRSKLRVFILGNKDDLRDDEINTVSEEEAYNYARQLELKLGYSISYLSTSALTGYNVEVAFNKLITEIEFN